MCGIFCSINRDESSDVTRTIVAALKNLEYRGYDSCGICISNGTDLSITKTIGGADSLAEAINKSNTTRGSVGIGHTRWATHGVVSIDNTHPHVFNGVSIVHNGIVENKDEISSFIKNEGFKFEERDNDTAIIPVAIAFFIEKRGLSFEEAFYIVCAMFIKGSSAIAGLYQYSEKPVIGAYKNNTPLIIGTNKNNSIFVTSDSDATEATMQHVMLNNECVFCYRDVAITNMQHLSDKVIESISEYKIEKDKETGKVSITEGNNETTVNIRKFTKVVFTKTNRQYNEIKMTTKGGYKHFTRKEISEQTKLIKETVEMYISPLNLTPKYDMILPIKTLSKLSRVFFIGCGSSYNIAAFCANYMEKWIHIESSAHVSSEFQTQPLHHYKNKRDETLFIFISQSGETMDSILSMKNIISLNFRTLAILNKRNSSMEQLADYSVFCTTTNEIGVAATKSFTAQLTTLLLIIRLLNTSNKEHTKNTIGSFVELHEKIENFIIKQEESIRKIAESISKTNGMFFIGREEAFPICLEGSLKMKEISYIHSEAIYAGELKHGHLAMIDRNFGTIAIVLNTSSKAQIKTISNIEEVMSRNGKVVLIAPEKVTSHLSRIHKNIMCIPTTNEDNEIEHLFTSIIATQLLAYHTADILGQPIDKPRNLAKSVTVE